MPEAKRISFEEFDELFDRVKNWGRWGADDQLGALNYITAEKRVAATAAARNGRMVNLGMIIDKLPSVNNPRPAVHAMLRAGDLSDGFAGDYIAMAPHGIAVTHIDALCHYFWKEKMYNGYPMSEVTSWGARLNAVDTMAVGVAGRGVLLDVPRLKGVDYLQPSEAIDVDDLEAAERAQNVRVEEGDVLLVRTGRHRRPEGEDIRHQQAGLHATCGPWLRERSISMLCGDAATDVLPSGVDGVHLPLHVLALVGMGVPLIDNCDMESLASACAEEGRWSFLFMVAPLVIPGGTASPVNPIAIF